MSPKNIMGKRAAILAALMVSVCMRIAAQDPNVDNVLADTLKDMRGNEAQVAPTPLKQGQGGLIEFRPSQYKTPAQSVSAGRLRHKVPKEAQTAYRRGVKLWGARKTEEAWAALRAAIAADPEFMQAHNAMGILRGMEGRYREAESEFQTALRLDPQDSIVHYNLGVAYLRPGQFLDAERWAPQAIALAPLSARARLLLGYLLLSVPEKQSEAIEHLQLRRGLCRRRGICSGD